MRTADPPRATVLGDRLLGDLGRAAAAAVPWLGGALLLGWLVVAVAHVDDLNFVQEAAGSHMALARYARDGVLYPPFFEDGYYGGTRMMPLPILFHAGVSLLTGEFLVAGKVAGYLAFGSALAVAAFMVRGIGMSWGWTAALLAAVTASWVGFLASLPISYDGIAAAAQLGAVALVARGERRRGVVAAGICCGLALLAKANAVWAVIGIAAWLLARRRDLLAWLVAPYLGVVVPGVVLLQLGTDGWFSRNLLELSSSSVGGDGLIRIGPQMAYVIGLSPGIDVLLVLAVAELVRARERGEIRLEHVAFGAAFVVALVTLTRSGAIANHFLEAGLLAALLAGRFLARPLASRIRHTASMALAAALTVALILLAGMVVAIPSTESRLADARRFLDRYVGGADRVLSENAAIPLLYGRRPVVLDGFTLARIGARHPELVRPLIERLEAGEFDRVVLKYRPEDAPRGWFADVPSGWYAANMGPRVIQAIQRNYVLLAEHGNYHVYVPRDGSS